MHGGYDWEREYVWTSELGSEVVGGLGGGADVTVPAMAADGLGNKDRIELVGR